MVLQKKKKKKERKRKRETKTGGEGWGRKLGREGETGWGGEKKNPKAKHDEYTQVSSFYTV